MLVFHCWLAIRVTSYCATQELAEAQADLAQLPRPSQVCSCPFAKACAQECALVQLGDVIIVICTQDSKQEEVKPLPPSEVCTQLAKLEHSATPA